MEIDYIKGPKTAKIYGMSRYQLEICKRINNVDFNFIEYESLTHIMEQRYSHWFQPSPEALNSTYKNIPFLTRTSILTRLANAGMSLAKRIDKHRYIELVKKNVHQDHIKHITYQNMAYILNYIPLENTIVTCHDLIPWVYENNRSSYWQDNMKGLTKSDVIITVSEFSKNEIIKHLNYPSHKIHIIPDAVDHSVYYPQRDKKILKTLKISDDEKIILYVGSETPRMNLPILVRAFAELKRDFPNVKLIKIGDPQILGARKNILNLIRQLDLHDDVIFTGFINDDELPLWYNAADLLVYPCSYAGFGLPPLEAMACGTPVITSNTTSMPEVVGEAGIMIDPLDIKIMVQKMHQLLIDKELADDLSKKGLNRAQHFNWDDSAKRTFEIYKKIEKDY
jgi:glycosyltransferase involved in cell wall biosynthesis